MLVTSHRASCWLWFIGDVRDPWLVVCSVVCFVALGTREARASDGDADGLPDTWELSAFGNLAYAGADDPDSDGLDNASEYIWGANPMSPDTDLDMLSDALELGGAGDADPWTTTNPLVADTDADGILDGVEDCNRNGLLDPWETAPWSPDTDSDSLADPFEVGSDPCAQDDADGDGLPNTRDQDSDGDGIRDAAEAGDKVVWTPPRDTDLDQLPDFLDPDSDDDSLLDAAEETVDATVDGEADPDADGDGTPNRLDLDSDDDGSPDSDEGDGDADDDGIPNYVDPDDATDAGEPGDTGDAGDATDTTDAADAADAADTADAADAADANDSADADDSADAADTADANDSADADDAAGAVDSADAMDGVEHGGTWRWPRPAPSLVRPAYGAPIPALSPPWVTSEPATPPLEPGLPGACAACDTEERSLGSLRGGLRCSSDGETGGQGLVWAFLLAGLLLRRRGALALLLLLSPRAEAGEGFDVLTTRLTAPGTGLLGAQSPSTLGRLGVGAGLSVEWLHDALRREGEDPADLVGDRAVLTTHAAFGVWDGADLGLDVPTVLATRGEGLDGGGLSPGLGDVRVWAKLAPMEWWRRSPVQLALIGTLVAPTGDPGSLRGGGQVAGELEIAAGGALGHGLQVHGAVGYGFEGRGTFADLDRGDTLTIGASLEAGLLDHRLTLALRLFARALARDPFGNEEETALEVSAAAAWRNRHGLELALGGGLGVLEAAGSPAGRLMASVGWVRPREEAPVAPADHDGDGVSDPIDRCPDQAEDIDGVDDGDGCPEDGDRDDDGHLDAVDRCPDEAEDEDGFQDGDGCPERDNDGDRVADIDDQCPLEPERPNGTLDRDGCPDPDLVRLDAAAGRIEVLESALVRFAWDDAGIPAEYEDILDQVAFVMLTHPEIVRLEVQGHASGDGERDYNLNLSRVRAAAVARGLVSRGVASARLQSQGYGEERLKVPGVGPDYNWQNRRVEFVIVGPRGAAERPEQAPQP